MTPLIPIGAGLLAGGYMLKRVFFPSRQDAADNLNEYILRNGEDGTPEFETLVSKFRRSVDLSETGGYDETTKALLLRFAVKDEHKGLHRHVSDDAKAAAKAVLAPTPTKAKASPASPARYATARRAPSASNPGHAVNDVAVGPARPAADALYHHLKVSGADGTSEFTKLVKTFQRAVASDPSATAITGPLVVDGAYGQKTSAALSVFTRDPVPADKNVPVVHPSDKTQILDPTVPGHAHLAGFNLFAYLLAHGDDGSETERQLVTAFQTAVNEDPKFPGPGNKTFSRTVVTRKGNKTGVYDDWTSKSLAVVVGLTIPPGATAGMTKTLQDARKGGRQDADDIALSMKKKIAVVKGHSDDDTGDRTQGG